MSRGWPTCQGVESTKVSARRPSGAADDPTGGSSAGRYVRRGTGGSGTACRFMDVSTVSDLVKWAGDQPEPGGVAAPRARGEKEWRCASCPSPCAHRGGVFGHDHRRPGSIVGRTLCTLTGGAVAPPAGAAARTSAASTAAAAAVAPFTPRRPWQPRAREPAAATTRHLCRRSRRRRRRRSPGGCGGSKPCRGWGEGGLQEGERKRDTKIHAAARSSPLLSAAPAATAWRIPPSPHPVQSRRRRSGMCAGPPPPKSRGSDAPQETEDDGRGGQPLKGAARPHSAGPSADTAR